MDCSQSTTGLIALGTPVVVEVVRHQEQSIAATASTVLLGIERGSPHHTISSQQWLAVYLLLPCCSPVLRSLLHVAGFLGEARQWREAIAHEGEALAFLAR